MVEHDVRLFASMDLHGFTKKGRSDDFKDEFEYITRACDLRPMKPKETLSKFSTASKMSRMGMKVLMIERV